MNANSIIKFDLYLTLSVNIFRTFDSPSDCDADSASGMLRTAWTMTDVCVDGTYATCSNGKFCGIHKFFLFLNYVV